MDDDSHHVWSLAAVNQCHLGGMKTNLTSYQFYIHCHTYLSLIQSIILLESHFWDKCDKNFYIWMFVFIIFVNPEHLVLLMYYHMFLTSECLPPGRRGSCMKKRHTSGFFSTWISTDISLVASSNIFFVRRISKSI